MRGNSRLTQYLSVPSFHRFINKVIRQIKRNDTALGSRLDLHQRGRPLTKREQHEDCTTAPKSGYEFFFSNVLVKVFQVPVLFYNTSEEYEKEEEGTFIVLIYEKYIRKRQIAKTSSQIQRLNHQEEIKRLGLKRFESEQIQYRDSKMRRFCNYFVTLYNQKKLNPFTHFLEHESLKQVKALVRDKMELYTNGNIRFVEEPQMYFSIQI